MSNIIADLSREQQRRRLMGSLIRAMLHLGERPTSCRVWIVTLGVLVCDTVRK